jgi:hypothetical protein
MNYEVGNIKKSSVDPEIELEELPYSQEVKVKVKSKVPFVLLTKRDHQILLFSIYLIGVIVGIILYNIYIIYGK